MTAEHTVIRSVKLLSARRTLTAESIAISLTCRICSAAALPPSAPQSMPRASAEALAYVSAPSPLFSMYSRDNM